jgi:hypothetical protein
MSTKTKNAKGVQGTTAQKGTTVRTENRPNITGKEAKEAKKGEPATDQKPAETPQVEATQATEAKAGDTATMDNQPANTQQQAEQQEVKAGEQEEPKAEIKYIKPVPNLEQTIKTVNDLHRRSIQRLALIARIKLLEDFEVKLVEENDELESNPYQGCKLIIKDDKNREFITNTPNLIRMVSQFIFNACHEKLAEIEANIVFPNA